MTRYDEGWIEIMKILKKYCKDSDDLELEKKADKINDLVLEKHFDDNEDEDYITDDNESSSEEDDDTVEEIISFKKRCDGFYELIS